MEEGGRLFRILGTVRLSGPGGEVELGPFKQRIVLGALLSNANSAVATDVLIDAAWAQDVPRTARKNLQVYISSLRKLFARHRIAEVECTRAGYRLLIGGDALDWLRFDEMSARAARLARGGDRAAAAALFHDALCLWGTGTERALADLRGVECIDSAAARMDRRRLSVAEDWADTMIAQGDPGAVVETLGALASTDPTRDRLRSLQMIALHRLGMTSQALAIFDEVRRELSSEYGLDPGPAAKAAHAEILTDAQQAASAGGGIAGGVRHGRGPAPSGGRGRRVALPPDIADFVGRETELRGICQSLTSGDCVQTIVIHGPAAAGKTCLAVKAAYAAEAAFPGGCVLTKCTDPVEGPRSPQSLLTELWHVAKVSGRPPEDFSTAASLWREHLSVSRQLIVLDGVRDEAQVARLLPGAGSSAALLTSHSMLPGIEPAWRVPIRPLGVEEALALLARIAGDDRVAAERGAAAEVVAAVGAMPVGIRAVGRRLALFPGLRIAEILRSLSDPVQCARLLSSVSLTDTAALVCEMPELREARTRLRDLNRLPDGVFTHAVAVELLGEDDVAVYELLDLLLSHGVLWEREAEVMAHQVEYEIPLPVRLHIWKSLEGDFASTPPYRGHTDSMAPSHTFENRQPITGSVGK